VCKEGCEKEERGRETEEGVKEEERGEEERTRVGRVKVRGDNGEGK